MIIISGTSRGIGKALAELYLAKGENVIGIGRTSTITHSNYAHLFCDLANGLEVENLEFPEINQPIFFIHNAGVLGEIGRFTALTHSSHAEVMQVNFNAGVSIFHQLIRQNKNNENFTCAFVSSGAGKRPIASWASYCASKAAVDLFLETVQAEENEKQNSNIRVYSFSPGVVDTAMQAKIREASEEHFSSVSRFINLHENNGLKAPKFVAEKILELLNLHPTDKVLWSISDFE